MKYYVYGNITGCHPSSAVAVLAVSRTDANRRISGPMWRGGKFSHEVDSGTVKADYGDVTDSAQAVLHEQLEAEYQHYKKIEARLTTLLGREPTWREMCDSL
jgi:hypothetical protein